ncbi:hypothetical protein JCM8115_002496 [Rhodotorula mucilaginosa]
MEQDPDATMRDAADAAAAEAANRGAAVAPEAFAVDLLSRLVQLLSTQTVPGTAAPAVPATATTQVIQKSSSALAKPSKFSGKVKDSATFVYSVLANLADHKTRYATAREQILFFTSYLEGSALQWFLGLLRRNAGTYLDAENARRALQDPPLAPLKFDANFQFDSTLYPFILPELLSFEEFLRHFNSAFSDPDAQATAERKIASLRQTTSVVAYSSEFQAYCYDMDDTPRRMAETFYKGLKTEIQDEVHRRGKPDNLTAMIQLAVEVDNHLQSRVLEIKLQEALGRLAARRSQASATPSLPVPRAVPAASTSTIAATTANTLPIDPARAARRLERIQKGLCLYCGEKGHIKVNCPTRPTPIAVVGAPTSTSSTPAGAAPSSGKA